MYITVTFKLSTIPTSYYLFRPQAVRSTACQLTKGMDSSRSAQICSIAQSFKRHPTAFYSRAFSREYHLVKNFSKTASFTTTTLGTLTLYIYPTVEQILKKFLCFSRDLNVLTFFTAKSIVVVVVANHQCKLNLPF